MNASDIFQKTSDLLPEIKERFDEINEARRVPSDLHQKLLDAGAFRITVPKARGGAELSSREQVELIEMVSKASGSVGWSLMIGCDSGLYAAYLDDATADKIYPKVDMSTAGWIAPGGLMKKVNGGYSVSGHWRFGSGIKNADVVTGGCMLGDENGEPIRGNDGFEWRMFISPASNFEILDTWRTEGLKGTGSHDYQAEDLFVPDEQIFDVFGPTKRSETLYQKPDVFLRKMPAIPLGVAQAALDLAAKHLKKARDRKLNRYLRDSDTNRGGLAKAEMLIQSSRSYLFDSLDKQWARLEKGEELSTKERRDVALSRINVFHSTRDAVRILYDLLGGTSIYTERSPMHFYLNDLNVACQHFVAQLETQNQLGGTLMDTEPHKALLW